MTEIIENKNDIKRIPLHIEGLDEQMQGGVPEGHIVLISGTAGSMKSSVTFNTIYREALKGKKCLYITLEQSYVSLLNHMINLDFDLSELDISVVGSDISKLNDLAKKLKSSDKGSIIISDLGAIRKEIKGTKVGSEGDWFNVMLNVLKKLKQEANIDIFVLDSLNALYALSSMKNPRTELFHVFEQLREMEITSFLISEMPLDKLRYSEYGIEDFLSDGIVVIEMQKLQRKIIRQINIAKMRATAINTDVFSLVFEQGKFKALYGGRSPLL